ncbi:MAG: dan, partial [Collimonas fungivorans]|uniref:amidohydrolase family protein n=1 Tax=Collimonas fungivorans TaxID=158899 RepID=UPI0026EF1739
MSTDSNALPTPSCTPSCDTLIRNVSVIDGSGSPAYVADVALAGGRILHIEPRSDASAGALSGWQAQQVIDGSGKVLSPGFIDVHTHDDTNVIRTPSMLPKLSQGVTTVVVGNCGISAAPVSLKAEPPDPMNLLGEASAFSYPTFASYVEA